VIKKMPGRSQGERGGGDGCFVRGVVEVPLQVQRSAREKVRKCSNFGWSKEKRKSHQTEGWKKRKVAISIVMKELRFIDSPIKEGRGGKEKSLPGWKATLLQSERGRRGSVRIA